MIITLPIHVHVFSSRDVRSTYAAALHLVACLRRDGFSVLHTDKLSPEIDDLLLVAEYRVVEPTLFLIVGERKQVLVRMVDFPTPEQAREMIVGYLAAPPS